MDENLLVRVKDEGHTTNLKFHAKPKGDDDIGIDLTPNVHHTQYQ